DEEDLVEDGAAIGRIEPMGEPELDGRSHVYTLQFPPQEHKIGGSAVDPADERVFAVEVDDERGTIRLRRGKTRIDEPLPRALIPPKPLVAVEQREAVL